MRKFNVNERNFPFGRNFESGLFVALSADFRAPGAPEICCDGWSPGMVAARPVRSSPSGKAANPLKVTPFHGSERSSSKGALALTDLLQQTRGSQNERLVEPPHGPARRVTVEPRLRIAKHTSSSGSHSRTLTPIENICRNIHPAEATKATATAKAITTTGHVAVVAAPGSPPMVKATAQTVARGTAAPASVLPKAVRHRSRRSLSVFSPF